MHFLDTLAKRLQRLGKSVSSHEDAAFDERLVKLCEGCEEEMPNLYRSELHKEEFFEILCNEPLLECVQKLMPGVKQVRIYPNYSCRPKTKSKIHAVTWHQDAGLRADGGPSMASEEERLDAFGPNCVVNCWTPLVEATEENGAMKFLPGSHRKLKTHVLMGQYDGATEMGSRLGGESSSDRLKSAAAGLQDVPAGTYMTGIESLTADDLNRAVSITCSPTDVVLFSNLLIHRGGVNRTDKTRWSFDWRFQDATKPTHRRENGHIVLEGGKRTMDAAAWANLSLTGNPDPKL